jgi:hypothetical protein
MLFIDNLTGDLEEAVFVGMKPVETELGFCIQDNQQAAGQADAETDNIDGGKDPVPGDIPESNGEIAF